MTGSLAPSTMDLRPVSQITIDHPTFCVCIWQPLNHRVEIFCSDASFPARRLDGESPLVTILKC